MSRIRRVIALWWATARRDLAPHGAAAFATELAGRVLGALLGALVGTLGGPLGTILGAVAGWIIAPALRSGGTALRAGRSERDLARAEARQAALALGITQAEVGPADGERDTFRTPVPYRPGSLVVFVDGTRQEPTELEPAEGTFTLPFIAQRGESIVAEWQPPGP